MKTEFRASFSRDLRKIRDKTLLNRVRKAIEEVETANALEEISHLKKLRGNPHYYRIRLGDYRLGVVLEDDTVTFVRFLHRKDIYRYFP